MLSFKQNYDPQIKNVAIRLIDATEIHLLSPLSSKLQYLPVPERTIAIILDSYKKSISTFFCWAYFCPYGKKSPGQKTYNPI
jgi:hypothetical protein